jgi:hypothetical protein
MEGRTSSSASFRENELFLSRWYPLRTPTSPPQASMEGRTSSGVSYRESLLLGVEESVARDVVLTIPRDKHTEFIRALGQAVLLPGTRFADTYPLSPTHSHIPLFPLLRSLLTVFSLLSPQEGVNGAWYCDHAICITVCLLPMPPKLL